MFVPSGTSDVVAMGFNPLIQSEEAQLKSHRLGRYNVVFNPQRIKIRCYNMNQAYGFANRTNNGEQISVNVCAVIARRHDEAIRSIKECLSKY